MLPSDLYLAELLGLTPEQYEWWRDEQRHRAEQGPQPAVVAGVDPVSILVTVAISVGLQLLGMLLMPSPGRSKPAELRQRSRAGQTQVSVEALAPKVGFNAVQEVASLGEPIPVVYANREVIDGVVYGGVRVNATLLWSQVLSLGGSQMLRAVFMLSEGKLASVEPNGFAIGGNTIGGYDLGSVSANEASSRLTVYYRPDGGRITSADRLIGRTALEDRGNAENDGAGDVFMAKGPTGAYAAVFSASAKPSTNTTFGLHSLIGNNLGYKLNPIVRPGVTARLKPRGSKGNANVVCDVDRVVAVQRQKESAFFSTRSGIISGTFTLGGTFTYRIDRSSDYLTVFQSADPETGTWTASSTVLSVPVIYERNTNNRITGFDFGARMMVGAVAVGTDQLEVAATFDAETVETKLIADDAAPGRYEVQYQIAVANDVETIEAPINIQITVERESGTTYIKFDSDVDEDSGPVDVLSTPLRVEALIVFPVEDLEAYSATAADVASTVTGRQKSWDDAIVVGDLYKAGSAWAVCTDRTPSDKIFLSDSEDGAAGTGITIDADFAVVKAGTAATASADVITADGTETEDRETATSSPHILRMELGNVSTSTECRIAEVGLRSTVGTRIAGLCNFRDTLNFEETDGRACLYREGENVKRGQKVNVDIYQSGTVTTVEERFSFFRVSFRESGSGASFTELGPCFGVRSSSDQPAFNYLTLVMPSKARWELRFEPLSGWEIRSGTASGNLVVLDAKLTSAVSGTSSGVSWRSNGETVNRARSTFTIDTSKRSGGMGLPLVDENNYVDAWGKLAEAFVYEEVQSSAANGPEHEIVYLNEIAENDVVPEYSGIALVGINAVSAFEWRQFSQFSGYITGGAEVRRVLDGLTKGPSHLFPDLVLDWLTNEKYGTQQITDDLINLDSFQSAAQWCQDRKYFFDGGVILGDQSPRQRIADLAGAMLLDFREVSGKYELVPFITFGTVSHAGLFDAGNIAENSFKYESVPPEDRSPIRVSVKWRQERSSSNPANPGLFPQEREVMVYEPGNEDAPIEAIDLSNYCTSEAHAIDVAKFTIRMRRLRDHSTQFKTTYDGIEGISAGVGPGAYIRVALDATAYDEFNNGVVLSDGTVVSTTPLADGTYDVVSWGGSGDVNDAGTLTIAGGVGTPAGIVFTVKQVTTQVRTYQISRITPTEEGAYDIEAVHMPTNGARQLLVASDWDSEAAWVIQR
jgi:hypothetical protein